MENIIKLWLKEYYSFTSKGNNLSAKDSADVEKDSSYESSAEGERKSEDKYNDSCCAVEEFPENFIFPGILAVLLYGPLKRNISARRTLDFFVSIKIQSRKRHYHALRPEKEKPMKKPLIANEFQIVMSIISSKRA